MKNTFQHIWLYNVSKKKQQQIFHVLPIILDIIVLLQTRLTGRLHTGRVGVHAESSDGTLKPYKDPGSVISSLERAAQILIKETI